MITRKFAIYIIKIILTYFILSYSILQFEYYINISSEELNYSKILQNYFETNIKNHELFGSISS